MIAVFDRATGQLVSTSAVAPTTLPDHLDFVDVTPMPERPVWDAAARTFVTAEPSLRTRLTRLEMRRRFTMQENVTLKLVKATAADPQVRATLETLEDYMGLADHVELADADTILGVQFAVQVLVGAGVVPAEDAADRIADILAPIAEEA